MFPDREKLIRFKFRWAEADKDPQDNIMSIDEFKSFRHPEQSKHMLDNMVMDIISSLGSFISVLVQDGYHRHAILFGLKSAFFSWNSV